MGWKDNRRRRRTWYLHYRGIARDVFRLIDESERTGIPLAPEAIVALFFDLYERRKIHGKKFIAASAYESMRLACQDEGLTNIALTSKRYTRRGAAVGELKPAEARTGSGGTVLSLQRQALAVDSGQLVVIEGRTVTGSPSGLGPKNEKSEPDALGDPTGKTGPVPDEDFSMDPNRIL